MNTNLEFPIKCISYYASNRNQVDKKHSFEWWMRGKLVRIISDKMFARGDMLIINNISEINNAIIINVSVDTGPYEPAPVLSFVSSRLVYNKYSKFEATADEGITILSQIDQITNDDNYSIGFLLLVEKSGVVHVKDTFMNNFFDVNCTLNWEK
jgi:hypothetical protein